MFCTKCNNHIQDCKCPDIDERLNNLKDSPYLAIQFCEKCKRHIRRCICNKKESVH